MLELRCDNFIEDFLKFWTVWLYAAMADWVHSFCTTYLQISFFNFLGIVNLFRKADVIISQMISLIEDNIF